jgi:hypothetical protein
MVKLIFGVAPGDGLQNRTCEFPSIRLLNELVFDNQTPSTASYFAQRQTCCDDNVDVGVANSGRSIVAALRAGDDMVDFNDIFGHENQVASVATTLLIFEQLSDSSWNKR